MIGLRQMKRAIISLLLLVLAQVTSGQTAQTPEQNQIANYLRTYLAEFNNRPSSLNNQFSGELVPMPQELSNLLKVTFPRHHFYIAKTYFSHWGPNDNMANILLVTEAASGKVVAHQWELFFSGASESFYRFLGNYPATSHEDALNKVKVLSLLMVASANNGSVGKINLKGSTITSELLLGNEPWRVLKVHVGKNMKFSRITMINSRMNKIIN
jgi:hypothetical protein